MLNIVTNTKTAALSALSKTKVMTFSAAPVLLPTDGDADREVKRRTHWTATASWLYIMREKGEDRFGKLPPAYLAKRPDLFATGRRHPVQKMPPQYKAGPLIWQEADSAAAEDPGEASAVHIVASLGRLPCQNWVSIVERFIDENLVAHGMVVDWAIHFRTDVDGEALVAPHVHMIATARRWRKDIKKGQRQQTWLYNKGQIDHVEKAWLARAGRTPTAVKLA